MTIFNAQGAGQIEARLYFGRFRRAGQVLESDFCAFLDDSVTPHFPGFTVYSGQGFWNAKPEPCSIVSILIPDFRANRAQCRVIAEQYNDRFNQEAVAVQFAPCQFDFVSWPHKKKYYPAD